MGGVAGGLEHDRQRTTRRMEGGGHDADEHRPGAVTGRDRDGGRRPGGPQGGHAGRAQARRFPCPRAWSSPPTRWRGPWPRPGWTPPPTRTRWRPVPLPGEVAAAIDTMAGQLGDRPLAVRSSGVDEDLPGASYAGQYESVLPCRPRIWQPPCAAAGPRRSPARSPPTGGPGGAAGRAMAVLVQPMVEAQAAGVAFTADPVTGDRDTALVSAVRGLGDRLARDRRRPTSGWCAARRPPAGRRPRARSTPTVAADVAALARRVEARLGDPPGHRVGPGRRRARAAPGAADHRAARTGAGAGPGAGRGAARVLGAGGQPRAQSRGRR